MQDLRTYAPPYTPQASTKVFHDHTSCYGCLATTVVLDPHPICVLAASYGRGILGYHRIGCGQIWEQLR